ncbi:MAG TPA: hypothetical protein VG318_06385 [Actinomycetota bacterium]|nr:hypothetical protein [Actinomycetota bacterium]
MKRSTRSALAVGAVAAVMALTAPAASAAEVTAAEDAAGCTTVLLGEAGGWVPTAFPDPLFSVTYTPPGTVTVDADPALGIVTYVVSNVSGDVIAYVECVV